MTHSSLETGSFRDRHSRVFYHAGGIFRGLSEHALEAWSELSATRFFPRMMAAGKLVRTERADSSDLAGFAPDGAWAGFLEHQAIPFVSYPYEWSFGMLKDAALLQLELLRAALDEDMILKDSSAFNCQWVGSQPVFIDIPSFEKLPPGEPWVGFRQFCQMFLYPLLLQAYKDVPWQPWLRGRIDGIEAEHCRNLMSLRDLLRPGVFSHVYLQAKLERGFSRSARNVRADLRLAGFDKGLIRANVDRLRGIVQGLTWRHRGSQWAGYAESHGYSDADRASKESFVREVAGSRPWGLVWDLGCNTGTYSRIAAENARYVVAMDADPWVVELLYVSLKREQHRGILPLLNNVADSSPDLGWRGLERKALTGRGRPELTLCLALVHHLVIGANIPLEELVHWLAGLGAHLVIEFVTREDPMVASLLRNKRDQYADYQIDHFERRLSERFHIARRQALSSGTRVLYYGQPA
jgi:hypothetical protein